MKPESPNFLFVNNTNCDISDFYDEIIASLKANGTLPEELDDIFKVTRLDNINPDGSPRYVIDAR